MNKLEVQQRVLQFGKPLDLDKFSWDENTRIFSSSENNLVLDFADNGNCTFKTGSSCTFDTGWGCTFSTSSDCTFKTDACCTFNTDWDCIFDTSSDCTFNIYVKGYFKNTNNRNNVAIIRDNEEISIYKLDDLQKDKFIRLAIDRVIEKDILPYKYIDDGVYVIKNEKQVEDYTIFKGQHIEDYFNENEEHCFIASKGEFNAHGATIKEAISDVEFKYLQSQGVQEHIKRVKEQGYITPNDYRLLTGACRYGTNRWLGENGFTWEDSKSIEEVLELTKGQYGHDKLIEIFKGNE